MINLLRDNPELLLIFAWLVLSFITYSILQNPIAFQRAGSFGVSATIIAFFISFSKVNWALEGILRLSTEVSELERRKLNFEERHRNIENLDDSVKDQLSEELEELSKDLKDLNHSLPKLKSQLTVEEDGLAFQKKKISKVEVTLLIIATLQWGYGDLLVKKLILCGDWVC